MRSISLNLIVFVGVFLTDGVNIFGAGGVEVKVFDPSLVGYSSCGVAFFGKTLVYFAILEFATGEGCDDYLLLVSCEGEEHLRSHLQLFRLRS